MKQNESTKCPSIVCKIILFGQPKQEEMREKIYSRI